MPDSGEAAPGRVPGTGTSSLRHHESQARKPRWVWALVIVADLGACAAAVWLFLRDAAAAEPSEGGGAGLWFVLGAVFVLTSGFIVFAVVARLDIDVYDDSIRVRWFPLTERSIPLSHVVGVEPEEYRPVREYGGWGIRGSKRRRAYSMTGNTGVLVSLFDGSTVMLGTEHPERLASAIDAARRKAPA